MDIYAMLSANAQNEKEWMNSGPFQSGHLHVNSIKLYADGALGSRGACLIEPYSDDSQNHGIIVTAQEELRAWCKKAQEKGFQVNTHAIGDSAVRLVLSIYSEFLDGDNDQRWRIEHAQCVHPKDFVSFKKHKIIPAINSTHATSDMYWAGERLSERLRFAYAYKELLNQNGWLCNGSDFPIESINPLLGFYAAVARKDVNGFPSDGFQMENALSREEALRAMTIWAAKASFEEKEKGSLEARKQASFVVLKADLLQTPLESIPSIRVEETWAKGERMH